MTAIITLYSILFTFWGNALWRQSSLASVGMSSSSSSLLSLKAEVNMRNTDSPLPANCFGVDDAPPLAVRPTNSLLLDLVAGCVAFASSNFFVLTSSDVLLLSLKSNAL